MMNAKPISESTAYPAFHAPSPKLRSARARASGAKNPIECTPRKTTKPTINTAMLPPLYFFPRGLRFGALAPRLRPPAPAWRDAGFAGVDRFDGLAALRGAAPLTD